MDRCAFLYRYVRTCILISWEHSKLMLKPYFRSTSEGQLAGVTRLWDRRNFLRRRETDRRAVVQSVSSPWCDQGLPIWPIFFCTLLTKVEGFVDVFSMWFRKWPQDKVFVTETRLYTLKKPHKPTYKTWKSKFRELEMVGVFLPIKGHYYSNRFAF